MARLKIDDIVRAYAKETGRTLAESNRIWNEVQNFIVDRVSAGDSVFLHGFGEFYPYVRSARKGVNPKTLERVFVEEMTVPRFAPGAIFRDSVRKGGKKDKTEASETA